MLLPYDPQTHTDLIADLHYKALPWSTNSQLGKAHIFKIYRKLATLREIFGFVWMEEGILVGYSIGSSNYSTSRAKIRSAYSGWDIFRLICYSFRKPLYFINAFETVFLIPFYLNRCGTTAEWLAWNTDKSHPKHNIAALECFFSIKKYFRNLGFSEFIGQGEKRSKESENYLDKVRNVKKISFIQNNIYILPCNVRKKSTETVHSLG